MSSITVIPTQRLPADLPDILRAIALRIEAGEVTEFVAAYVENDNYEFLRSSSDATSLVLASLLQSLCVEAFRG